MSEDARLLEDASRKLADRFDGAGKSDLQQERASVTSRLDEQYRREHNSRTSVDRCEAEHRQRIGSCSGRLGDHRVGCVVESIQREAPVQGEVVERDRASDGRERNDSDELQSGPAYADLYSVVV